MMFKKCCNTIQIANGEPKLEELVIVSMVLPLFWRNCICWLLTYFLVLIQNEVRLILDSLNYAHVYSVAPAAIFACKYMKMLFAIAASAIGLSWH